MYRRAAFVLLLGLAAIAPVACREKKPTGPDLSTPRAAALTFTKALEDGDTATARLACNASGLELELVEAMAQSASGIKKLNAAARAKFGDEAKKLIVQQGSSSVSLLDRYSKADVDQDAERAVVKPRDGRDPLQLQRREGKWRVDVGALIKGKDVSRVVPYFRAAGAASRKVAGEIDAGQHKTLPDAQRAVFEQINTLMPEMLREAFTPSSKPKGPDIPYTPAEEF